MTNLIEENPYNQEARRIVYKYVNSHVYVIDRFLALTAIIWHAKKLLDVQCEEMERNIEAYKKLNE